MLTQFDIVFAHGFRRDIRLYGTQKRVGGLVRIPDGPEIDICPTNDADIVRLLDCRVPFAEIDIPTV